MLWYLDACQIQIAVPLSFLLQYLTSRNTQTENASLMSQKEGSQLGAHIAASELQPSEGNLQTPGKTPASLLARRGKGMQRMRFAAIGLPLPLELPRSVCKECEAGQGWDWSLPLRTTCQSVHAHTDDHLDSGALRDGSFHARQPKSLLCLLFGALVQRSWIQDSWKCSSSYFWEQSEWEEEEGGASDVSSSETPPFSVSCLSRH